MALHAALNDRYMVSCPRVRYGGPMRILAPSLLLIACVVPALAGETPWQDMGEQSRIRLVSADTRDADGTTWVGLDIALAPGTKTYWRIPGETGIPITIALAEGSAATIAAIDWPYPRREMTGPYMDYVYHDRLILPFALAGAEDGARIAYEISLGLCTDICIPVTVRLDHVVQTTTADGPNGFRILQARALAPVQWTGAPVARLERDPETGGVLAHDLAPHIDPDTVIAEIVGAPLLFDAADSEGSVVRFAPLGRGEVTPGATVRLTFDSDDGPYFSELALPDER